jgi:uncharacterized repeat protein (TIGR01451 family)
MKKILPLIIVLFSAFVLPAGNWNPYVSNATVYPAPLFPYQLNGTGELFFKVGNSGDDIMPFDPNPLPNNNMILKITLSYGIPNNANPLAALGGTWVLKFTWSWNSGTNTYTGYQNTDILGQSEGDITIQYKVTTNSTLSSPQNGFNVQLTPPPYTNGINSTGDDGASSYTFTQALDFGDAPASYGAASHERDFANYLGLYIDNEPANQPSADATGDDLNGVPDDEDGVTFPTLVHGNTAIIPVVTTGIGFLNLWIDWNGDGDFNDTISGGEHVITNLFIPAPLTNLSVPVPANAVTATPTFARFRFAGPTSYQQYPKSFGYVASGEVEDYQIQILPKADLSITKTDNKTYFTPGINTVYTVTVTNGGPDAVTGATVTDNAPSGTTISGWTAAFTNGSGSTSGSGNINQLIDLSYPGSVIYTVTLNIPCSYSSATLSNTAGVAVPSPVVDPAPSNNSATDNDSQNTWTGTVSSNWNTPGNWTQGVPDCSGIGALIPDVTTNDPVISTTGNNTANLTILSGGLLTINASKELKVCGCTEIDQPDGLYLKSDATGNAKFIDNGSITYTNGGSAKVELYLTSCTGTTDKFRCWHYITPPVYDAQAGVFNGDYMRSWDELTGTWSPYYTHSYTLLNELQGYAVNAQGSGVRTFHGQFLTGNQTTSPDLTRTENLGWGWNLVGNPYSSPIDLNSAGITWNNVDAKVYYLDQADGNYKVWPASNPYGYGTGTQYALSMQGFFVHVNEAYSTGSITFTNAARTFTSDHIFYKDLVPDLLWLNVSGNATGLGDDIIVCMNDGSTSNYDALVDAQKLTGDPEAPQLSSVTTDQVKATVNTLPFAGKTTVVPLDFYVTLNGSGNYTFTASNLETFRTGSTITLEDKLINTTQVLTDNPVYHFTYTDGDNSSRFLLHFYNPYFGIDEKNDLQDVAIYSYEKNIYVKDMTGKELKGEMVVYNLVGQTIVTKNLTGGTLNKFPMSVEEGYYLVEVFSGDKVYHGKVYLTR